VWRASLRFGDDVHTLFAMDEINIDKLSEDLTDLMKDYEFDNPNWDPLEKVLPLKWCAGFMWMGATQGIHLYKHGFTRRYLNLDGRGNAYRYLGTGNRYARMDLGEAIEVVFEGLEEMRKTRESPYDDDAVREKHEALAKAGWTTINVSPDGVNVTKPAPSGNGISEPTPNSNRSQPRRRRAKEQPRREDS
jgi:hypothetical protein